MTARCSGSKRATFTSCVVQLRGTYKLNGWEKGVFTSMRLSVARIKALQALLKDEFGLTYTDEQTQAAGLSIMRFIVSKHRRRASTLTIKEKKDVSKDTTKPKI